MVECEMDVSDVLIKRDETLLPDTFNVVVSLGNHRQVRIMISTLNAVCGCTRGLYVREGAYSSLSRSCVEGSQSCQIFVRQEPSDSLATL